MMNVCDICKLREDEYLVEDRYGDEVMERKRMCEECFQESENEDISTEKDIGVKKELKGEKFDNYYERLNRKLFG